MNKFVKITAGAVCAMFVAGASSAATVTDGDFMGLFRGNDSLSDGLFDSPGLYKCDDIQDNGNQCTDENGAVFGEDYSDGDFGIVFDTFKADDNGDEATGGTWSFLANNGETHVPHYMVLKAGNQYAVYDILGLTGGSWFTGNDLGEAGISHISFYNTGDLPTVPVPAAGLMLLGGLGAFGALRRRRKS